MTLRITSAPRTGAVFIPTLLLALLLATPALAETFGFVGARSQAMGGTGVAFVDDSTATYWNPANLGLKRATDVQLPATFGANIENKALENLTGLIDQGNAARGALRDLDNGLMLAPSQVDQISELIVGLADYGRNGEAVHFDLDIGIFGRHNGLGFQVLSNTTGVILPNLDVSGIALSVAPGAIADFISMLPPATASNQDLVTDIEAFGNGWDNATANQFVARLEQQGADTTNDDINSFILDIGRCTADPVAAGCGGLSVNDSGALATGLSTQEFGISYGRKLPFPFFAKSLLDRKISVGATMKYMMGVTFVQLTSYSDAENPSDIISGLADFNRVELSHNFGLDLGVTWRPFEFLSFGMVARNVNSPDFSTARLADGTSLGDVSVDAQVRVGAVLKPIDNLILSFDIDATENRLFSFSNPNPNLLIDYGEPLRSRILSLGSEYNIEFSKSIQLALRFGVFNNVSGAVNQDWALSGGLGLKLWQFFVDLSLAGSTESELIRTGSNSAIDVPTRLNAGITLKWERSL